jgi:hypothetical protein
MVLDEAAGMHAMDFLHPRRPPRSISRLRLGLIAGAAAALVLIAVGLHTWMQLSDIQAENRQLAARLKDLDTTMKKVAARQKVLAAVAEWHGREIKWLEELRDLSIRFPGPRDAVVLRMSLRSSGQGVGQIDFNGLVRDPKIVANLEHLLRDEYRQVRSDRVQQRTPEGDYTSLFQTRIRVTRRPKEAYLSHLPESPLPEPKEDLRVAAGARPEDAEEVSP